MKTRYQLHVEKWSTCTRCDLCRGRSRVVLLRGSIPCDVLFVGEAPGESEDAIGKPFIGPAGKLLDSIIQQAIGPPITYALTNLIGCIPREEDGEKAGEPPDEAIEACIPRVQEIVRLCNPKLIVRVGKHAQQWLDTTNKHSIALDRPVKFADIVHPAAIIRANVAQQGLAIQRCVVTIQNAIDEMTW